MPAFDAARKRVSQNRSRRMGRQQAFANSRDRAFGVCIRNFAEHALRCRRDIAWLSRARGHDFFRWVSPMAAFGGHGVLPSSFMSGSAHRGPASFRATKHDQCRLLRHSRRTWCRFRDSHHRTLSPGARRRRTASASHCHVGGKTWTRGFLWCAHDSGRFSRARC